MVKELPLLERLEAVKQQPQIKYFVLLRPTSGNIIIDNKELKNSEQVESWQSLCSYVPQSINLLNSDILSNIAYGLNEDEIDEKKFGIL